MSKRHLGRVVAVPRLALVAMSTSPGASGRRQFVTDDPGGSPRSQDGGRACQDLHTNATTPALSEQADPRHVAAAFWDALYARDWPRIRSFFGPESIYYDVPTGPASAARGPEGIEARLQLGLEGLAGYDHGPATVVADGPIVVTEHVEHWTWASGEKVSLPFVSVQHVHDGVITLWRDYWDLQTLMNASPASWRERLDNADLSWLFDATDVVP